MTDLEPVYLWVDGVYVKAGLEKDKAAMLVILAGLRDGRKVILAVESGYRESTESWAAVLRDLKARGLRPPRLVVGDGHLGIGSALLQTLPGLAAVDGQALVDGVDVTTGLAACASPARGSRAAPRSGARGSAAACSRRGCTSSPSA